MQLKRLAITQVRVFEQAEFEFQPDMNLLVGVNGAGKSTVLDVLRIMLSQALPRFTAASKRISTPFEKSDITIGRGALTAELEFEAAGISFEHLMHLPREEYIVDESREGEVRGQTYDLIERNVLKPDERDINRPLKKNVEQPLAVYFSTHRSLFSPKQSSTGGQAAAFVNALSYERGLRLREFANWWLALKTLADEDDHKPSLHRLAALDSAVTSFLDDCTNLRAAREPQPTTLLIDKNGITLDVRQLSDGERGMVALALDLTRRLAQANPELENPLRDGKAVVLIDELDLHLHPYWQRIITQRLTTTFPNCQFIATTHSPQIIGEVSPENIILIEDGEIYCPNQSLGMDSNWILQYLMGTPKRRKKTERQFKTIENLIEDEQYDKATAAIDALRDEIGEHPDLVGLQTRIDVIEFLSDDIDEGNE